MGMKFFWTFIFVSRMHRGACVDSDCNLGHLCALAAFLQHAVQDEWQRVGANTTTEVSPVRLKPLICFLTSVHHFYSLYCLSWTCTAIQYILPHAPDYG
jgi:hypothetical protein